MYLGWNGTDFTEVSRQKSRNLLQIAEILGIAKGKR
jgi:hypothetical protein